MLVDFSAVCKLLHIRVRGLGQAGTDAALSNSSAIAYKENVLEFEWARLTKNVTINLDFSFDTLYSNEQAVFIRGTRISILRVLSLVWGFNPSLVVKGSAL